MTIRGKLLSIIFSAIVAGTGVIAMTIYSVQAVNEAISKERQSSQITSKISALLLLTQEYLILPSPRIQQQWKIIYAALTDKVRMLSSDANAERILTRKLEAHLGSLNSLFDRIVALHVSEQHEAENEFKQLQLKNALTGRLLVEAGQVQDHSNEIKRIKIQNVYSLQDRNNLLLMVFILALALVSIVIAYMVLRGIVRPIAILKQETSMISQGKFEHPIQAFGDDEFSDLAYSFEDMRKNLLDTMVSKKQLESYIEERTAELREARDQAEKASMAKSQFLSSMSHELRTPLNAILGFGQLLDVHDGVVTDKVAYEYVNEVLRAGYHLLDLINEVLDLSRIESGNLDIQIEPVPLKNAITECLSQLKAGLASKHNITLNNQIDDPDLVVLADPRKLRQVFINLLSNAVKYNVNGGSVTIMTEAIGEERVWILFTDTGKGIAAKDMHKLFDPFERLSYKHSNIDGTGIGLTVTRQLVEAMEGTIGVESIEGQGSTFWVEMPLATTTRTATDSETTAAGKKFKLLYIEDDPMNTRLIQDALKSRENIEVITSSTAEHGITQADEQLPDIILMDIKLPGIDGFAALEILRNVEATNDIPVIALTANAMNGDAQAYRDAGFNGYISKPIDMQQLYKVIDEYLI